MDDRVDKLFVCSCNSIEHQLIMTYFTDENSSDVYCSVHLKPEPNVFKRIWKAAQYVFGHRSNYGDFDEFIFKSSDADSLQQIVDYLKHNQKDE